ncbi:hypothetical protein QVN83_03185 [Yersinia frederiksenii]|uniref:hypothetical protein n=1 Tax=Yersinia frederiksenii TaxID=29484 RepID=UPI0025AB55F7|nr:hypothetical protein [Yersinia frederiksenii]MDN0117975.1 hypothetical protein [Yersinia frederiksenii]
MISNDFIFYFSLLLAIFFMVTLTIFFVFFIYKELGGVKVGRDSFLFFDYMLFGSGWKANIPVLSMLLAFISLAFLEYIRGNDSDFYVNAIGFIAIFLFFVHCRFFSTINYSRDNKIKFIGELFYNFKFSPRFSILWLSRVCYIAWVIFNFYK